MSRFVLLPVVAAAFLLAAAAPARAVIEPAALTHCLSGVTDIDLRVDPSASAVPELSPLRCLMP
ncbi:hypothetical protein [Nonomuraea aridisoli]|uniref:Uncharacterized protein n=1 Tax=Nonomuraea aridisoli TaxID=2070368 RepID=A0A2W2DS00_9ACTN|nr:hypothetical protein [Nonomuraea aridisoli]PZG13011.1 hypothetical protein C1J01_31170 [Nonomuraea aridisoli]